MNPITIYDRYCGRYVKMDADKFIETLECANKVRKAKHKGAFSANEFLGMFGFTNLSVLNCVEINKSYLISAFNEHSDNGEVVYVLDYSL